MRPTAPGELSGGTPSGGYPVAEDVTIERCPHDRSRGCPAGTDAAARHALRRAALRDARGDSITADVWTTFTLNDCPAALWDPIDAAALATERGATFGLKNGPRHWLIDELQRGSVVEDVEFAQFAGLEMVRVASVQIDLPRWARENTPEPCRPPQPFHLERGQRVYELVR